MTRLGDSVDATGRLQEDAMQRVFATLARYRELIDEHGATATTAVLTSAVRDAANGADVHRHACASASASTPARSAARRRPP